MDDDRLMIGLSALSQPIRLLLYRLLVQAGAAGSGPVALSASVGVPRNLVSYHLQPLVAAGLVRSERRGRDVNYRAEVVELRRLATRLISLSDVAEGCDADPGQGGDDRVGRPKKTRRPQPRSTTSG